MREARNEKVGERKRIYIYVEKKTQHRNRRCAGGGRDVLKDERGDLFLPACVWPSVSSHV